MSGISTHVLDTALGKPAQDLKLCLSILDGGAWRELSTASTDPDGRVRDLLNGAALRSGTYRLSFDTGAYHGSIAGTAFYPSVDVTFHVDATDRHYHIPLLLSPYGYSTYRGS